jgi:hypothetical protein
MERKIEISQFDQDDSALGVTITAGTISAEAFPPGKLNCAAVRVEHSTRNATVWARLSTPLSRRIQMRGPRIRYVALVVLLLLAGGCATRNQPSKVTNAPAKAGSAVAAPSPTAASILTFAETAKWDGGVQATVNKVAAFRPNSYAAGYHQGDKAVKIQIKLTNRGTAPFDLALVQVTLNAGPDGVQCDAIYDDGIADLTGTIQPGRSASAWYAYSVAPANMAQLDVAVTPSFDSAPATFEGKLP